MDNESMKKRYDAGFAEKCAEFGIAPEDLLDVMEKRAQAFPRQQQQQDWGIPSVWDAGAFRFFGNIGRNLGRGWRNIGRGLKNWWGGGHGGYEKMLGWMEDPGNVAGPQGRQQISAKAWANMNDQQRMGYLTGPGADRFQLPDWGQVRRLEDQKYKKQQESMKGGLSRQQAINKHMKLSDEPWKLF